MNVKRDSTAIRYSSNKSPKACHRLLNHTARDLTHHNFTDKTEHQITILNKNLNYHIIHIYFGEEVHILNPNSQQQPHATINL